jgi:SNF2 family DNA or RNA helicase
MRVIFITNLESTAGVNLQSASDIILYNDMPPSIREQIIGRANRIGRVGQVTVHTLRVDRGSQGRSA